MLSKFLHNQRTARISLRAMQQASPAQLVFLNFAPSNSAVVTSHASRFFSSSSSSDSEVESFHQVQHRQRRPTMINDPATMIAGIEKHLEENKDMNPREFGLYVQQICRSIQLAQHEVYKYTNQISALSKAIQAKLEEPGSLRQIENYADFVNTCNRKRLSGPIQPLPRHLLSIVNKEFRKETLCEELQSLNFTDLVRLTFLAPNTSQTLGVMGRIEELIRDESVDKSPFAIVQLMDKLARNDMLLAKYV